MSFHNSLIETSEKSHLNVIPRNGATSLPAIGWMFLLIILFSVPTNSAFAQLSATSLFGISSNFRIYPSNVTQTEVFVTRHPSNNALLFSSANTINLSSGFISEGIYISNNGGATWNGSDTCKGAPLLFHRGDPGITIDKDGKFILTRLGFQDGLFSHVSTDNGLTWSSQRTIAGERQDRASITTDINSISSYYGRTYTAYVELLPPFPLKVSFTVDGGLTWSVPTSINNPVQRSQGAELAIGIDSNLFAVWAGVQSVSPYTEDFIGFARSVNGGVTWSVVEQSIDMNGIQGTLPQKSSIRVNGLPKIDVDHTNGTHRGWIYIVTTQKNFSSAGNDPDVILYRSSNNGQSWSQGIRANQDPLNNGKIQYFPAVHVDNGGGINVLYYDDRNTTSDSVGIFLSRSTDGGDSWNDFQIGDHHFRPQAIGGLGQGYQGDNISMTSVGGTLIPMWMDNSSGIYQIWSSQVPIATLVTVKKETSIPAKYQLTQNFPNPFNPSTTIQYSLQKRQFITVKVFDLLGREVSTLVETMQSAGEHFIVFDAPSTLSSGIYFYQLKTSESRFVKKMILQK
ncbi:MAG: T9SS type A sorting domain-containing protein [Bacteroidota bacterium]